MVLRTSLMQADHQEDFQPGPLLGKSVSNKVLHMGEQCLPACSGLYCLGVLALVCTQVLEESTSGLSLPKRPRMCPKRTQNAGQDPKHSPPICSCQRWTPHPSQRSGSLEGLPQHSI
jgi:hypothetical protein